MKAIDAIREIKELLLSANIEEPQAKARAIVSHVMDDDILAEVPDSEWSSMLGMAKRACNAEPVEYITGKAYFRYLELDVSPDVLIPRKETELVAGTAIDHIKENGYGSALDMCTGSGCIAISIATETDARVDAVDISEEALRVAKSNAQSNNGNVDFYISDMFQSISGTYDIIVSNPPYINDTEYETLSVGVKEYEPALALKSGDGLIHYKTLAKEAREHLNAGGALVLEIGADQSEDVTRLLKENGFAQIETRKDYQGRDRIVIALKGR